MGRRRVSALAILEPALVGNEEKRFVLVTRELATVAKRMYDATRGAIETDQCRLCLRLADDL